MRVIVLVLVGIVHMYDVRRKKKGRKERKRRENKRKTKEAV